MQTLVNSVRSRRSISPVVDRLLELCVVYQQQQQNNQNVSSMNTNDLNKKLKKRIKDLVKQFNRSKRDDSIEELQNAILHKDSRTRCVTIQRSSETQTNLNTVMEYCRLWRWPDLSSSNELKPIDFCPNAFHYNNNSICINPYHYERMPTTYSVHVPRLQATTMQSMSNIRSATFNDNATNVVPTNTTYTTPFEQQQQQQQQQQASTFSPESISSQDSFISSPNDTNNDDLITSESAVPMELDTSYMPPAPNPPTIENLNGSQITFEEPYEWCHISYYEMADRVGEKYRATQSQVIIDGFTHPSNAERFCLGGLTNVQRTRETDKTRRFIGRGVKLFHVRGNVFAECLSDNPVFVQSPITNIKLSWHPATVCKIPPNVRMQIFDSDDFTRLLTSAVSEGYESVYNLMKMCIIRMSLVKGWGVEYPRHSVTATPCWIEIYLDGPLKWLDTVLFAMRGPDQSITSVS